MTKFFCFLTGFLLGGGFMTAMMCCFQLHRSNEQDAELRRLRAQLNNK